MLVGESMMISNDIKCVTCLTDSANIGKFYTQGCDIKSNLDKAEVGLGI